MSRIVFLRDDDAYKLDGTFRSFFHMCLSREIPVVYGVIPGKMTGGLRRFLTVSKKKFPGLIDIVQHGWMHINHSTSPEPHEFGATRTFRLQKKDIKNGLRVMDEGFGKDFTKGFIPPYHGFNGSTLKAVRELGFSCFSSNRDLVGEKPPFANFVTNFDLNDFLPVGPGRILTEKEIKYFVFKILNGRCIAPAGLLFHHECLGKIGITNVGRILTLLQAMKRKGYIRFALFSDLLEPKLPVAHA